MNADKQKIRKERLCFIRVHPRVHPRLTGFVLDSATVRGMKYPVALIPTEEGYSVSCPGLPGCWSQGATEEEALANIRDAIVEYLEVARN